MRVWTLGRSQIERGVLLFGGKLRFSLILMEEIYTYEGERLLCSGLFVIGISVVKDVGCISAEVFLPEKVVHIVEVAYKCKYDGMYCL